MQPTTTWMLAENTPALLAIARATIRAELCGRAGECDGIPLPPEDLALHAQAGCFLPQVARETGWGREQLLERLCVEKMGLPAASWRSPHAKLQTFTTIIIGPEPLDG